MSSNSSHLKKLLIVAAKLILFAVVAWFVRDTLLKAWRQIGNETWQWHPFWLGAAGAIYIFGLLPAGLYWFYILKILGQDVRLSDTLRAYYIGHLGKYVPGKATVVILRTMMIRGQKVDTVVAVATVFFETLTMMAVGAFFGGRNTCHPTPQRTAVVLGSIGLMIVSGLPVVPPIFKCIVRLAGSRKTASIDPAVLNRLGWSALLLGFACMSIVWVFMAASLWATFQSIGISQFASLDYVPEYIAAVSLAMVAGFVSFIPAGLGVRDLLLVELILKLFNTNAAIASVVAGVFRLIWLVSELIISGILYLYKVGGR